MHLIPIGRICGTQSERIRVFIVLGIIIMNPLWKSLSTFFQTWRNFPSRHFTQFEDHCPKSDENNLCRKTCYSCDIFGVDLCKNHNSGLWVYFPATSESLPSHMNSWSFFIITLTFGIWIILHFHAMEF